MLYRIVKPFAKIILAIYFRKIYLSNLENIPKDKPLILAANHPSAFIEPCILACWLPRRLYFLARGDFYLKPWIRRLYNWFGLIPVFQLGDAGYGKMKDNFGSFGRCFEALKANKPVMILAEGRVKHEKRLRPIMKGTARLAFGALEKYGDLDLHIVPVGVNYTDTNKFRSVAMFDFGAAIRVQDYIALYNEHPVKAVNALTKELAVRLRKSVIHIEHESDDIFANQLLELRRNELPVIDFPPVAYDASPLLIEKQLADIINELSEDKKQVVQWNMQAYFSALETAGVSDLGVAQHVFFSIKNALLIGIGWLPYMVGKILNAPPLLLADWLSKRLSPTIEFRASLAIAFGLVSYLLYWLLFLVFMLLFSNVYYSMAALALPILGYHSVMFSDYFKIWKASKKAEFLEESEMEKLLKMRAEIFNG